VAASIAVGADGKPVVATTDQSDITLFRLTPGGALDATFGGPGSSRPASPGQTRLPASPFSGTGR
jgi:hypothetical protein